jgi:ketosteroid isomerase-like protein
MRRYASGGPDSKAGTFAFTRKRKRAGTAILRRVPAEKVEIVRRHLDAWNRADVDAWLETFHPEIEWSSAIARQVEGDETVWRGPAEMRRFWDDLHSLWNHRIEVSEIRDRGDTIVALGRIQTRGKASGVELDSPVAFVMEFDGDLIRKGRSYRDPRWALEAVGLRQQAADS